MAKSNSTAEQLDIARNLLAVTQQMAAAVDAVNKKQMDQVQIMTQIQDAMKAMDTKGLIASVDAATKAINELTAKLSNLGTTSTQTLGDMSGQAKQAGTSVTAMAAAVTQAGNAATTTTNSTAKLATTVQDNTKKTQKAIASWGDFQKSLKEKFPKAALFASSSLSGLASGFKALGAGISFGIDAFKDVVGAIMEIGKAIISLPLNFLDMLTEKANKLASGTSEWFEAVQEVKDAYGSVQQTASSALISMAKNSQSLAGTGVNARRVWGSLGAQLKAFNEIAGGMGALFDSFADEFAKTGKQLPAFAKGLGLGGEEMRSLAAHAKSTGISMTSLSITFTKQSLALAKQFGVSAKLISKDMAKALGDVKHFGGATVKQIASASVYARKLGLELDKITGTLDAFETFEGAADNASKLSQAFGVQVDAFKMMEAQDPAQQIDMLRKSFAAAGKDASTFNRQQLSLLASATGLDEATAKQAFSMKNQGVSLDKINKKSDEAEKRQIDQTKALRELADAMKLVTQSGSSEGGFLDKFLQGITQGFERTTEFRGLMRNMVGTFHVLRGEGRRLGDAIMHSFPGVKTFFEGLKEIFDPKKFSKLAGGVVDELIKFFKEFTSGKYSFKQLMEKITGPGGVFDKFMGSQGEAGKKVVEGFKTMWSFVTKVTAEAIRWLSEKVASGIKYIGRLISGKEKLTDSGAGSFLADTLGPIWEALGDAWNNIKPILLETLENIGNSIWNWAKEKLLPMLSDIAPYVIGAIFAGAALKGLLSVALAGFGKLLTTGLTKVVQGAAATANTAGATASAGQAAASAGQAAASAGATTAAAAGAQAADTASKGLNVAAAANLGLKLVAIAGALAVGGVLLATAVIAISYILKGANEELIWQSIGVLAVAALASLPMMLALNAASAQTPGQLIKGGLAIAGSMFAMGGAAVAIIALSKLVEGAKWETIGQLLVMMAGIVLLSMPMLGVMFLAAKIPLPGVKIGALTMTAGVIAMAATAWVVVKMLSGLPAQDVDNAAKMLVAVSSSFLMMVPILIGASAIGAVLVGTLGIGATLMISGMAALALGVMEVAKTAVDILKSLQEANLNSSAGPAIDSFLKVMEVVVKMFDSIGGMFETLLNQDFKNGEKASTKLDAGGRFITSLIGTAGSGTGIIGIAETLLNSVRSIKADDLGPSAEIFTNLLGAIPGILTGLTPSESFYKACEELEDEEEIAAMALAAGAMTTAITTSMSTLIDKLKTSVEAILKLDMPDPEKAKGVGAILSGLGSVMQSMMPDPKLMEAFRFKVDAGWFGTDMEGINFEKLGTFFTTYLGSLKDTLPALSSGIISSLVGAVAGIPVDQIGKLAGIGTILGALGELINSLSAAQKNNPIVMKEVNFGGFKQMLPMAASMSDIIGSLGDISPVMSRLIDGVKILVNGMPTGTSADAFEKQIKIVVSLFSLLKSIPELATAVKELDTVPGVKEGDVPKTVKFDIKGAVDRIQEVLSGLIQDDPKGSSLSKLMTTVTTISRSLTHYQGGTTMAKAGELVSAFFGNLQKLSESLKAISGGEVTPAAEPINYSVMESVAESAPTKTIKDALGNLDKMLNDSIVPVGGIFKSLGMINGSMGSLDVSKVASTFTTFIGSLTDLGGALEEVIGVSLPDKDAVGKKFDQISQSLGAVAKTFGKGAAPTAPNTMTLAQVEESLKNVDKTKLNSIATNFTDLAGYIKKIKSGFDSVTGDIDKKGLLSTMEAVNSAIEKVNTMNQTLHGINAGEIKIKTGLKTLASGLGIGGSNDITVKNKAVEITMHVHVDLHAGMVERAIVLRQDSIIRDRLNFATQNPGLTGAQGIIPGVNPARPMTAGGGGTRKTGAGD